MSAAAENGGDIDVPPFIEIAVDHTATAPLDDRCATPEPNNELDIVIEPSSSSASIATPGASCEMCANYETQLQHMQETERTIRQQLTAAQHLVDRYTTELSGERLFRTELESKINTQYKECGVQLREIDGATARLSDSLAELGQQQTMASLREQLKVANENRASVQKKCEKIYDIYSGLLKTRLGTAEDMRDAPIDLPQDVDDLQLMCLNLRENLIDVTAAKENLEQSMGEQIMLLRQQMEGERLDHTTVEKGVIRENNELRQQLGIMQSKTVQLQNRHSNTEHSTPNNRSFAHLQKSVVELERKLQKTQHDKSTAIAANEEGRRRMGDMQRELDTSESVQRDFVKLSQSLQMKLELIRQNEQEVRWQYDEDVLACNGCDAVFAHGSTVKLHCRHCGRIFCDACLSRTVVTGGNKRNARVCELCHTLLCSDARPYFSDEK